MADIYVKLGEKANSFSDPISQLNISGKEVIILTDKAQKSKKTNAALKGGHLVRASRTEYEAYNRLDKATRGVANVTLNDKELLKENKILRDQNMALKTENEVLKNSLNGNPDPEGDLELESQFEDMTDEELVNYYTENYQVSDSQIKTFSKLTKEKKVTELIKLETPEE